MEVGQVSFKDQRKVTFPLPSPNPVPHVGDDPVCWLGELLTRQKVKRILVPQRENPIVNRLNKTKVEKKPDLKRERDDRLRELRQREQAAQQQRVRILFLGG